VAGGRRAQNEARCGVSGGDTHWPSDSAAAPARWLAPRAADTEAVASGLRKQRSILGEEMECDDCENRKKK